MRVDEDLVDLADVFPARSIRIVCSETAAGRTAGLQRRSANGATLGLQPQPARSPASDAQGTGGQIVKCTTERGESAGERGDVEEIGGGWQRRQHELRARSVEA